LSLPVPVRLDHVLLRRAFLVLALAMFAPFTPDPVEFAVGGFVPWLVLRIVGTPTLPAAVVFYLIWQWLQVYARTLVSVTDGEEMARGLYGPWVVDAYWYMLASIVALALAIRAVLGGAWPPSPRQATAHLAWLARGDVSEQMRSATSISVGYMSENYADLAFPGMLAFNTPSQPTAWRSRCPSLRARRS
jgi:hypothetical protein